MSRAPFKLLAMTLALAAGPCLTLADDAAEQAVQTLIREEVPSDRLEELARRINAAAAREPKNVRWRFGQALVLDARGKDLEARDILKEVVEREPGNAEYQARYGKTIFESIDENGLLSKVSWARTGKAALERAVQLDPEHIMARQGLVQFFAQAPTIAGGSLDKAEEQAKALLAVAGGRGEFRGRLALARVATARKDWAEVSRQYALAETAKGDGANAATALALHASALLGPANDPKGALALAQRLAKLAKPEDTSAFFLLGEAYRKTGDCSSAVDQYKKVLAVRPEAMNTRYGLAQCYEALGDRAEATRQYEEFARRFPKDSRAADATSAAKRLRKTS